MIELKRTGNFLKVTIPNYLTRVKLTEGRRKKYFEEDPIADSPPELNNKIPVKYRTRQYIWYKGYLLDTKTNEYVVKNAEKADEPRYQQINGNKIYARMHESKRVKIVTELKNYFKRHIYESMIDVDSNPKKFVFLNPVSVKMTVYTQYGVANWDADNMWIYHKCFLDSLKDLSIVRDDNVLHVKQTGQTTFVAIKEGQTPIMEFMIEELEFHYSANTISLFESPETEIGEIQVLADSIFLGTGKKKVIYGAAKKAVRKAMYHCLNNFKSAVVTEDLHKKYENFFECFVEHRVGLIKVK